jgi:hypothetical protein
VHRFRYFVQSTGDTRGGNEDLGSFKVEVHERGIDRASSGIVQHILESDKWKSSQEEKCLGIFPKTWIHSKKGLDSAHADLVFWTFDIMMLPLWPMMLMIHGY